MEWGANVEAWVKIVLGLGFLIVSVGYLYRPVWILKINSWGKALLFNDGHLLLYRRRRGLLFLLTSVLFLYSGFINLTARWKEDIVRDRESTLESR